MNYHGVDYTEYQIACSYISTNDYVFNNFKNMTQYNRILEHVPFDQGQQYLDECLKLSIPFNEIKQFCEINDAIGNPLKFSYQNNTLVCSPTSLRYVFHSHIILRYIKECAMLDPRIVEVGGGYGGLCLAIHYFSDKFNIKIKEYNICDLEEITQVQQKYISHFTIPFPFFTHNCDTFGKDIQGDDLFLISNYCFSEISKSLADQYTNCLLPKCQHGFLAWNMNKIYDFGKQVDVKPEVPSISPEKNCMVYF